MLLIVHLLLGYRRLQDMRYYQDDTMVRRLLGLQRLPDVATVSHTILPRSAVEVRMDSAFFSDAIVDMFDIQGVEFTISVPFERFAELKSMIEDRRRWCQIHDRCGFFESRWKPKSWGAKQRFVFIRTHNRKQYKEPVQIWTYSSKQLDSVFIQNSCNDWDNFELDESFFASRRSLLQGLSFLGTFVSTDFLRRSGRWPRLTEHWHSSRRKRSRLSFCSGNTERIR